MSSGIVLPLPFGTVADNFLAVANRGPAPSGFPCVNSDGRLEQGYGIPETGDASFDVLNRSMMPMDNPTSLYGPSQSDIDAARFRAEDHMRKLDREKQFRAITEHSEECY